MALTRNGAVGVPVLTLYVQSGLGEERGRVG